MLRERIKYAATAAVTQATSIIAYSSVMRYVDSSCARINSSSRIISKGYRRRCLISQVPNAPLNKVRACSRKRAGELLNLGGASTWTTVRIAAYKASCVTTMSCVCGLVHHSKHGLGRGRCTKERVRRVRPVSLLRARAIVRGLSRLAARRAADPTNPELDAQDLQLP